MSDERLKKLEKRVTELEAFKKTAERFMREIQLRDILYYAYDALELTETFQDTPAGYYCPTCFFEHGEFHPVSLVQAGFQTQVGQSMENAECVECGALTTLGSRGNRVFR